MIGEFALAAAPAEYRVFKGMDRYNPDKTWRPTDDLGEERLMFG